MRNWLENRYVVLTGASSGIGRELCKLLVLKYKAKVIGIGRKESKMLSLKEELGESADKFTYRLFDVGDKENWTAFKTWLSEENIEPILLINNAGAFPTFSKVLNVEPETAERIMRNNYFSIVYAVNALSPVLKGEGRDGRVFGKQGGGERIQRGVADRGERAHVRRDRISGHDENGVVRRGRKDEKQRHRPYRYARFENGEEDRAEDIAEKKARRSGLGRKNDEFSGKDDARKRNFFGRRRFKSVEIESVFRGV